MHIILDWGTWTFEPIVHVWTYWKPHGINILFSAQIDLFKNWIMESLQEHTIKESSLTLKLDQQVLKFPAIN